MRHYLSGGQDRRLDVPPYTLVFRRIANDTKLPVLQADYDNIEVSFLWKPALSMLFGEDEYQKWAEAVALAERAQKPSDSERDDVRGPVVDPRPLHYPDDEIRLQQSLVRGKRLQRIYQKYSGRNVSLSDFQRQGNYWDRFGRLRSMQSSMQRLAWDGPGRDEEDDGKPEEGWGTFYQQVGEDIVPASLV